MQQRGFHATTHAESSLAHGNQQSPHGGVLLLTGEDGGRLRARATAANG
jgi:hypothetical protein